jgi:hypothetical protein
MPEFPAPCKAQSLPMPIFLAMISAFRVRNGKIAASERNIIAETGGRFAERRVPRHRSAARRCIALDRGRRVAAGKFPRSAVIRGTSFARAISSAGNMR